MKIENPNFVYLIRGGHESLSLNIIFGFHNECLKLYNSEAIWQLIVNTYSLLSIGAVLKGSKTLCISGGLSPDFKSLTELKRFIKTNQKNLHQMPKEIVNDSILSDLFWGVPIENESDDKFTFAENGMGYKFPFKSTFDFLF